MEKQKTQTKFEDPEISLIYRLISSGRYSIINTGIGWNLVSQGSVDRYYDTLISSSIVEYLEDHGYVELVEDDGITRVSVLGDPNGTV